MKLKKVIPIDNDGIDNTLMVTLYLHIVIFKSSKIRTFFKIINISTCSIIFKYEILIVITN